MADTVPSPGQVRLNGQPVSGYRQTERGARCCDSRHKIINLIDKYIVDVTQRVGSRRMPVEAIAVVPMRLDGPGFGSQVAEEAWPLPRLLLLIRGWRSRVGEVLDRRPSAAIPFVSGVGF